jgi:serine/threonine-protein kinase
VQSLTTKEQKTIIEGGADGRYLPTGHLVYALGGSLYSIPFDVKRLAVDGGAVPIVEGVRRAAGLATGAAHAAVSGTGSLVYVPGPAAQSAAQVELVLADRKGTVQKLKLPPGPYFTPRVSPNGREIAFASNDGKEDVIVIAGLSGDSTIRRLTYGGNNRNPVWSADGKYIAYTSDREGDQALFWQPADNTGQPERLTKPDPGTAHTAEAWNPAANVLLFSVFKAPEFSLWTLAVPGKKEAPIGVRSTTPPGAVFSRDGRWLAYSSNATGSNRAYVEPFPATGAKYQIYGKEGESAHHLVWSSDNKELIYNPRPQSLEAVSVTTQPIPSFGPPVAVQRPFQTGPPNTRRPFDMLPDGRFVALASPGQADSGANTMTEVRVVLNWFEELKARVPIK